MNPPGGGAGVDFVRTKVEEDIEAKNGVQENIYYD